MVSVTTHRPTGLMVSPLGIANTVNNILRCTGKDFKN